MALDREMAVSSDGTERFATPQGFMALATGTRLDNRYTIDSVIAAGGFGITYLGRHDALAKIVAIKEHFPRQFAYRDGATNEVRPTDPGTFSWALDRFLQEGRALAACKHPHVVDVTDIIEANGTAYMVLGYEEGQSLKSWLDALGRPPTQKEVDVLLGPLLDALEFVHAQDLLHRDIAPDNVLIRPDGRPCLIDFGAARQAMAQRSQLMSAIVKSGYSPPEQYTTTGKAQGPWSDIYALGATLYRVVTGRVPPEATERVSEDELWPLASDEALRDAWRPGFLAAIDAALALKQAVRPQSVGPWRQMLLGEPQASAKSGLAPTVVREAPLIEGKRSRAGRAIAAGTALALLMSGGGYYGFVHLPAQQVIERQRIEEEARKKADAVRRAAEQEAERKAVEEQQKRAAEDERRRVDDARRSAEAKRKAAEERRRIAAEAEARRRAEEEAAARSVEERRIAETEQRRRDDVRRKAEEDDRRRADEEAARKAEEDRQRRTADTEQRRKAEEQKRLADEKAKREEQKQQAVVKPARPVNSAACTKKFANHSTCSQMSDGCKSQFGGGTLKLCNAAFRECMQTGRWIYRKDDGTCFDWGTVQKQ
jgi:hypothetical protein